MICVNFHRRKAEPGSSLAKARIAAHSAFDVLWQNEYMTRSEAYEWLADQLGIPKQDCHMLYFDEETCIGVAQLCEGEIFRRMFDL